MKLYRRFVADRTVRTHLVVVSMPSLAFCARLVEAEEPVRVQALRSELAVERFDERVVGSIARSCVHDAASKKSFELGAENKSVSHWQSGLTPPRTNPVSLTREHEFALDVRYSPPCGRKGVENQRRK